MRPVAEKNNTRKERKRRFLSYRRGWLTNAVMIIAQVEGQMRDEIGPEV